MPAMADVKTKVAGATQAGQLEEAPLAAAPKAEMAAASNAPLAAAPKAG